MGQWLEDLPPISPLHFFQISFDLKGGGKLFSLPDFSSYLEEERFVEVKMGWHQEALIWEFFIKKPFEEAAYPDFRLGDSIELFINTRDPRTVGYVTRFCHHFFILPKEVQGVMAQEITRLRMEEARPLALAEDILIETEFTKRAFQVKITLFAKALHGFDPEAFNKLGFAYRVNRPKASAQHFSLSTGLYALEKQPTLWSTILLSKGGEE